MLQHPATDFYDLAAANAAAVLSSRQTPPYSPTGLLVSVNNNSSSRTPNSLSMLTHNGGSGVAATSSTTLGSAHLVGNIVSSGVEDISIGSLNQSNNNSTSNGGGVGGGATNGANSRESLPSFGFTQEQVACVCEVSTTTTVWKNIAIRLMILFAIPKTFVFN